MELGAGHPNLFNSDKRASFKLALAEGLLRKGPFGQVQLPHGGGPAVAKILGLSEIGH